MIWQRVQDTHLFTAVSGPLFFCFSLCSYKLAAPMACDEKLLCPVKPQMYKTQVRLLTLHVETGVTSTPVESFSFLTNENARHRRSRGSFIPRRMVEKRPHIRREPPTSSNTTEPLSTETPLQNRRPDKTDPMWRNRATQGTRN